MRRSKTPNRNKRTSHTAVSLFSGAMGLDLGLEQAGFSVKVALEINNVALETIRLNRPRLPVISKSIRKTSSKEILEEAGLRRGQITVLLAGPCCQSFSTVGRRGSLSDDRGSLFREFCRMVRETRPRFFVMENVKGILSAAVRHRPLDERGPGFPTLEKDEQFGSALMRIKSQLVRLGYYVVFGLVNAADYGVPQKRWRVFFIGSRDGEGICIPPPTHRDPAQRSAKNDLRDWITLREALKGIRARRWLPFADDRLELLRRLKPGQNWRSLPRSLQREALGAAFKSWGGRSGFCRRLRWDQPSPTVTTAPDGRATMLCHPTAIRPLSVEECAAIQQFPENWKFAGKVSGQYVQVGNAVPLGLGTAIGRMLKRTMKSTARRKATISNYRRRGKIECDPQLLKRLKNRKKTQLHPVRLRKVKTLEAAKKWLRASAA